MSIPRDPLPDDGNSADRQEQHQTDAGTIGTVGNLLRDAEDLAARGWTVIPLMAGKKVAAIEWKQYQKRKPAPRELRAWFGDNGVGGGIAVVLGSASGGLACRDFDDMEAYDRWAYRNPGLANELPTVITAKGRHVYFHGPDGYEDLEDGEYRADSGHYCVAPPSLHPKGVRYEWMKPLPPGELPRIADPVSAGLIYRPLQVVNTRDDEDVSVLTSPVSVRSCGVKDGVGDEIEIAIRETLPRRPGQRHDCVFGFLRRIKAMPRYAAADVAVLKPVVKQWHRKALPVITTKPFEETWRDVVSGWDEIKFPAGQGIIDWLWEEAGAIASAAGRNHGIDQLIRLCELLQVRVGDGSFFLGCRTVKRLAGVSHVTGSKWLLKLREAGVIRLEKTGSYESREASEYRFTGERQVQKTGVTRS